MKKSFKRPVSYRFIVLLAILLLVLGTAVFLMNEKQAKYTASPLYPHATKTPPSPSSPVLSGNQAKTAQSGTTSPTPIQPQPSGETSKLGLPPSSSASFIQSFSIEARDGGQYIATVLSQNAASGKCAVTLSPSSGSPATKAGTIVSSGSYLSCDFGGIIQMQGHGTARLTVTGANNTTDSKDTTF